MGGTVSVGGVEIWSQSVNSQETGQTDSMGCGFVCPAGVAWSISLNAGTSCHSTYLPL